MANIYGLMIRFMKESGWMESNMASAIRPILQGLLKKVNGKMVKESNGLIINEIIYHYNILNIICKFWQNQVIRKLNVSTGQQNLHFLRSGSPKNHSHSCYQYFLSLKSLFLNSHRSKMFHISIKIPPCQNLQRGDHQYVCLSFIVIYIIV